MTLTIIIFTGIALASLLIYLIYTLRALHAHVTEKFDEVQAKFDEVQKQFGEVHRSVLKELKELFVRNLGDHGERLEHLRTELEELIRSKRLERLATVADLRDEARTDRTAWQTENRQAPQRLPAPDVRAAAASPPPDQRNRQEEIRRRADEQLRHPRSRR